MKSDVSILEKLQFASLKMIRCSLPAALPNDSITHRFIWKDLQSKNSTIFDHVTCVIHHTQVSTHLETNFVFLNWGSNIFQPGTHSRVDFRKEKCLKIHWTIGGLEDFLQGIHKFWTDTISGNQCACCSTFRFRQSL